MPRDRTHTTPRTDTEETRRAILRAANDLFMELGYRAVTTRMVADACGVKQPLLYYHFADKETLFLEVHREQAQNSRLALERIAHRRYENIQTRLYQIVGYLRRSHRHNMGMFFHELQHEMSPAMRTTLQELFQSCIIAPIMSIFEEGIQSGFLRSPEEGGVNARFATFMLLSSVSQLAARTTETATELATDQTQEGQMPDLATAIVNVLLYGMTAKTEQFHNSK